VDEELCSITVSCDKMCKALGALNINKASGPDGLNPRVLKELCHELANPLTYLFNKSMNAGKLPKAWKEAEVRPIFKKGDKSSAGNYRPVSLTSIVCKVFEGFVRDALCKHLITNNLLSDDQFGFTSGRSCVTQLLVTLNDWFGLLEEGLSVDAVYLDLKKAFDTVPHHRLITKLKMKGYKMAFREASYHG
jgi:Reverse transcriptase (RNA-dependent DNA polymerase)